MDQVKIEGGILGESFFLKQEDTSHTHREIVEICIEDIQSGDDDDFSEENDEFQDNTETYCLPDDPVLVSADSEQIKFNSQNVSFRRNNELERNSGVIIIEENEESDIINAPLKHETNLRINSPNTSLSNETMGVFRTQIGERNVGKINENKRGDSLFPLLNTKQATPEKRCCAKIEKENSLLYKLLMSKRDDKKDLCDDQATSTIRGWGKEKESYQTKIDNESISSNSNSLLFSLLNREKPNSKKKRARRSRKATGEKKSRRKKAEQAKPKQKKNYVKKPTKNKNSRDVKIVNKASEQEIIILDSDSDCCENLPAKKPKCSQPKKDTGRTSVDKPDKHCTNGEIINLVNHNQSQQKDSSKSQIEISGNGNSCNNKSLLSPETSISTQKNNQGLPMNSNLALVSHNGLIYVVLLPNTGKNNQVNLLANNSSMNKKVNTNHPGADLSSKHTIFGERKLNNALNNIKESIILTDSESDEGSTDNKLSEDGKEISKDQSNRSNNINKCVSVKDTGNNDENVNNKVLQEGNEIEKYKNKNSNNIKECMTVTDSESDERSATNKLEEGEGIMKDQSNSSNNIKENVSVKETGNNDEITNNKLLQEEKEIRKDQNNSLNKECVSVKIGESNYENINNKILEEGNKIGEYKNNNSNNIEECVTLTDNEGITNNKSSEERKEIMKGQSNSSKNTKENVLVQESGNNAEIVNNTLLQGEKEIRKDQNNSINNKLLKEGEEIGKYKNNNSNNIKDCITGTDSGNDEGNNNNKLSEEGKEIGKDQGDSSTNIKEFVSLKETENNKLLEERKIIEKHENNNSNNIKESALVKDNGNNKLLEEGIEIRKDQNNSLKKECETVKKSGNNHENTNNTLLEKEKEIRRDQNNVESRNSNTNYNHKESIVSREINVPYDEDQSKAVSDKVSIKRIKKSDPFDFSSDDDDIFGNDWDMESQNDNQIGGAETDGTREKPVEECINNSSLQEDNELQEKQCLENKKKCDDDLDKTKAKPVQQDINDNKGGSDNDDFCHINQETKASKAQDTGSENDEKGIKRKRESPSEIEGTAQTTISNGFTHTSMFNCRPQTLEEILEKRTTLLSNRIADCEFVRISKNEYECNHCRAIMNEKKKIEGHIRRNHRRKKKCPHCHMEVSHLKTHLYHMHTDEKDIDYFKCHMCDYKTKRKPRLAEHILYKHTQLEEILDKMHKCDQCPKTFKIRKDYIRHKERIHDKKGMEYRCFHCNFKTFFKGSLVNHVKEHANPNSLQRRKCPHCEFTTLHNHKYYRHVSIHARKIFQCHVCSYRTHSTDHFNLHLISHKEIKDEKDYKYKCDKCDYKTYRHNNLRIHKLNHLKPEEIEYFYCYHCNFKAKRKDNLRTHIHKHLEHSEVPFQCFVCNFITKNRGELIRHIDKHSKEA